MQDYNNGKKEEALKKGFLPGVHNGAIVSYVKLYPTTTTA